MLATTASLKIRPQLKLKILKVFIPSQISFDLKMYDISLTWFSQQLDSKIYNSVRTWLEFPVSTCVAEILALPTNQGGLGVQSLTSTAQLLRLGDSHTLRSSKNKNMNDLWEATTAHHVVIDSVINSHLTNRAINALRHSHSNELWAHIQSLVLQGSTIVAVSQSLTKSSIEQWSSIITSLAAPIIKFVRKAIVQQLPTATNLVRWGKTLNPFCPL